MKPDPRYASLIEEIAPLSPDEYYNTVFHFDDLHYRTRVDMAGFTGARRVLDAGSGYGQWAVALACANDQVVGIDVNPNMVEISRRVAARFGARNTEFKLGRLPALDFPDESFDLIWCWGVIMFVDRQATLSEFRRLLKPGGRVLVGCVNGTGRWVYKALRALNPLRFQGQVVRVSLRAIFGGGNEVGVSRTSLAQCPEICARAGLELVAADYDGRLDVTGAGRVRPMFPPRFLGLENNLEYLARRDA